MKYPVHVLCVMSTLDRGGAESMVMSLFRKIDKNKVLFDFVKHTIQIGAYEDEIKELGGKIYIAPRYKIINHFVYRRWWREFLELHPEYKLIHGHFFTISAVYFKVAQSMSRITIGHSHSTETIKNRKEKPVLHWVVKQYLNCIEKYTDYALACSDVSGKWLFKKRPFIVLHNAVDAKAFRFREDLRDLYRSEFGVVNEMVLGTVANLSAVKNPMGLIDIFLAVKKNKPDAKLLWVGEGTEREAIENRIHTEGIADDIILLGRREDVPMLLQAMDYFLLPSFNEGLPVSVIEAQAAGLPCFISDRVTKEVDITGLCHFFPIDKPDKWAKAILECPAASRDTYDRIIKAGYDIVTTAKWLEDFYIDIVNRNKRCDIFF